MREPVSVFARYSLSALGTALALLVSLALRATVAPHFFALFLAAVLLSAWYGGLGPAVLAIGLSLVALAYLLSPTGEPSIQEPNAAAGLVGFLVVAILIVGLTGSLRHMHQHLEKEVQAGTAELVQTNERLRAEIAEREQAEEARRRASQEAERLQGALLVGRATAHALNNDITVPVGLLDMLRTDPELPATQRRMAEDAAERLTDAAQHIAQFQRAVRLETTDTPGQSSRHTERGP